MPNLRYSSPNCVFVVELYCIIIPEELLRMCFVSHPEEQECIPQIKDVPKAYWRNTDHPIIHPIAAKEIRQQSKKSYIDERG